MQETLVQFHGQEDTLEKGWLPTSVLLDSPGGSDRKESTYNAGDLGLIPGLGRSSGGGQPTPVFLPTESSWTEEPGGPQSIRLKRIVQD